MRAVVMKEFGPPGVLEFAELPDPVPGADQVVIDVAYASVTFVETQVRAGNGPFGSPVLPRVPGNGVGGVIVSTGPGVDVSLMGKSVVATTGGIGGYAERAVARLSDVVPIPEGVGMRDAVALLADGRTALMLFKQAGIKAGERVLIEAAAGGVGSLLVQLALQTGAFVVGGSGSAPKAEVIRSLGAFSVDYSRPDWIELTREILARQGGTSSLDLVFDGVGGTIGTQASTLLRPGGRLSLYGVASGSETDITKTHSIQVIGLSSAPSASETIALIKEALDLAAIGKIQPLIGQIYTLANAAQAHSAIEARATVGKTLLTTNRPSVSP